MVLCHTAKWHVRILLMIAIVITSLPALRRKSYNVFYYVHVICSFWVFVVLSVHASTDFYFLLPGLVLWIGLEAFPRYKRRLGQEGFGHARERWRRMVQNFSTGIVEDHR